MQCSAGHEIHYLLQQRAEMPLEDYETLSKVGSGKYAAVYRVRRLADGTLFAMKKIQLARMSPRERTNAISEVRLLTAIRHPNIVALVEAFYDEFIETLCLVLELAEEGDLSVLLSRMGEGRASLSEQEVWSMVEQVSKGLEFMHSHSILHRDIKASNILIFQNGRVKIGDLNVSKLDNGLSYTRTGTLTYASPEVWKGERYDSKCDIWSFGCVLYEMLCLRKPFEGESMEDIYRRITKGQYDKIVADGYSKELRDLPTYMLQLNPKLRPSAATLCKMARNKGKKMDERLDNPASFNLANISVPGLESLVESNPYLQASTSAECNLLKRSMSRHKPYLAPILPAIRQAREGVEPREVKSRYNCRNLSRLPSFHNENTSNLLDLQKEDIETPAKSSNNVFKRLSKINKFKVHRRNTEL